MVCLNKNALPLNTAESRIVLPSRLCFSRRLYLLDFPRYRKIIALGSSKHGGFASASKNIFHEKWTFWEGKHRTPKLNETASLIYHINNSSQNLKSRLRANIRPQSARVFPELFLTKDFIDDMKRIASLRSLSKPDD